jgi:ribonuclease R
MTKVLPSREEVLQCLSKSTKAVHAGFLAKECGVDKAAYRELLVFLNELADEGVIRREGPKRFKLEKRARPARDVWDGILTVNPRGFGFVACAGKPDVFIPAEALNGAMHGDTVTVQPTGSNPRGTEGKIVAVVTRRGNRVAGILHRKRRSAWLEPDDTRVRGPIVVRNIPDDVGDGLAAVVEITQFPESIHENPEGELVAVLGKPGEAAVEVAKIKARELIEEDHPPAAMLEAERYASQSRRLVSNRRTDLRHVPFLTIDPVDARDHDDAVCVERHADGFRAYIAIADVSEYVTLGSALDEEALKRGCTIYLPDRAIPMLPGVLAADLCSLLPDKERYCLCVIAELDKDAKVTRFEVVEGLMRAVAMVSYESVARSLGYTDKPALNPLAEAFKRDLKAIASLTTKLRQKRMRRGALDLDLPEPKIELDDQGAPSGVHQRAHDPGVKKAYQMVEELMLLANELVAQWLTSRKAPAIYRVHGKPDEEKLGKLMAVADALGAPSDLDELLEPKGVGDWLKRIQKHPRKTVLEGLLLRSLKQAVYDVNNVGHFGLASDAYLHFTSPIRRYPDLLVHRLVKALLRDGRIDDSPEALDRLRVAATRSSARERAAMSVEREVVDLYRALYMQEHLGEMFEGTVISFAPHGVFVNIEEPFVDVLVRFESIGRERYELSDNELYLVAPRSGDRIQLGDKMTVEIEEVSLMRRSIYGRRLQFSYSEHAADDYWTEAEVRSYQGRGTATGKRKARTQGKPESQDSDSRKSTPKRNGASNGAAPKRGGSSAKPANPPQKSAGSKPKGANGTAKNVGNNTAKNVGNNTAKNAGNNTTKNAGNNTTKKGNAKPTGGASQRRKASKGKRH